MAYVSETPRAVAGLSLGWISDLSETVKLHSARRKVYTRTLNELRSMNERELADIGLSSLMIEDIAREAAAQVTL
ncbi:DUF1127 domain-containing protein [Tropicimonas sp. IMCC6043]|uniref:DUF1127 domain-containing protein n=1 Tax=Tropicimonas sp. IMCC6043 TaxID=2510645 RepID=UPI0013EC3741|nr:DUF1127 domain-containing protein [Tropicimonas sp. IMCC6043]